MQKVFHISGAFNFGSLGRIVYKETMYAKFLKRPMSAESIDANHFL